MPLINLQGSCSFFILYYYCPLNIRTDDQEGRHLCDQDKVEPHLQDALQYILHERQGADAVAGRVCGVQQGGKGQGNGRRQQGKRIHEDFGHKARIVTYVDEKKHKLIRQLTNDLDMPYEDIVAIYKKRWAIESLFKQLKMYFSQFTQY